MRILKLIYLLVLLSFAEQAAAQVYTNVSRTPLELGSDIDIIKFKVDKKELYKKLQSKTEAVTLSIPFPHKELPLQLTPIKIHTDNFQVVERSPSGDKTVQYTVGRYYKGKVVSDENSSVILSVHNGEISGVISHKNEVYNFGKMKFEDSHILYKASDVKEEDLALKCGTQPSQVKPVSQTFNKSSTSCTSAVEVYFECDYQMFLNLNSSSADVTNYVNTMFAQVYTLYGNESIDILISEIVVWTSDDGYTSGTSALSEFATATQASGFNGDIGHLLTNDSGANGGVAYVDQLCGTLPFAYSDIQNSNLVYPSFSWDVQVVAHEMGHNFGSSHTHDCVWGPNNDEQIDDCGNIAVGGGGSCYDASNPIVPSGGGTVMSYCHLNSVGINFTNGFGVQPGDLLRAKHSACYCDNSVCEEASVLSTSGSFFAQPNNGNGASNSAATHADWFEFTPPTSGTIDIASCDQGVDTRVWLHNGTCGSLTYEAMSDDDCTSSGSSTYAAEILGHSVVAGTTYYLEWDNRWSTAGFNWDFTFTSNGGGGLEIICPADYTSSNNCSSSDYEPSVAGTASSNTTGTTISYSDNMTSTDCTVFIDRTWIATNTNGSTASCVQMIDLHDDIPPVISSCPADITVSSDSNCQISVSWIAPAVSDACTSTTMTNNYSPGEIFGVGTYNVSYTFSDLCNNSSNCLFDITVLNGCHTPISSCDSTNISLSVIGIATDIYHAEMLLDASGTVLPNQSPVFKAGLGVELKPGFEVKLGGTLEAMSENCNN